MKTIFTRDAAPEHRLLFVFLLSMVLMFCEQRFSFLDPVRSALSYLVAPAHYLSHWPTQIADWFDETFADRTQLIEKNRQLEQQNLLMQRRVMKMAALAAENIRLRALLNSSSLVEESVIVAEVIGVDPDPFTHQIILNRGSNDGVYTGQAVLDARGLMGQVVSVEPWMSRVMLVADTSHAIPVQINRNGVRAIAAGSGFLDKLVLKHMPDTADVKEGDLLVSSGLGGRFPFGYPVAQIVSIQHDPGKPFAEVVAKPKSRLNRVRHVLLVFKSQNVQFDEASDRQADAIMEEVLEQLSDELEQTMDEMEASSHE